MTIYDLLSIVRESLPLATTPKNILAGFSCTGVWPFNRYNFSDSDFAPSTVTDRPLETQKNILIENKQAPPIEKHTTPPPPLQTGPSSTELIAPEILEPFPKADLTKPKKGGRKRRKLAISTDIPEKMLLENEQTITECTVEHEKRRAILKKQKKSSCMRAEKQECLTYESGSGLNDVSQDLPQPNVAGTNINEDGVHIVIFDLETALGESAEICQTAASYRGQNFNSYIMPSRGITAEASRVAKLTLFEGEMFLENTRVETQAAKAAHLNFIDYLKKFCGKMILAAHNGFRFDAPKILKASDKLGVLNEFLNIVIGFADSLEIFKKKLVQRQQEKKSFSLENFAADYLLPEKLKGAHNAIFDVSMVYELFSVIGVTEKDVKDNTKPAVDLWNTILMRPVYDHNKADLKPLKKVISVTMINKIVKACITMSMLKTVHKEQGNDGIRILPGESVNKKPRTTNCRIYQAVCHELIKINSA
ncbi:hypothetical protein PV325_009895 [Microctonus aethiopoides]|nr:hypothetical protein PV325_009895 [Microctonus aethiopoides]KAK0075182.1 hypothetical protein PV326_011813 [Microctonus aethiopoides]